MNTYSGTQHSLPWPLYYLLVRPLLGGRVRTLASRCGEGHLIERIDFAVLPLPRKEPT